MIVLLMKSQSTPEYSIPAWYVRFHCAVWWMCRFVKEELPLTRVRALPAVMVMPRQPISRTVELFI